jgi:hypothetical protein
MHRIVSLANKRECLGPGLPTRSAGAARCASHWGSSAAFIRMLHSQRALTAIGLTRQTRTW